MRFSIIGHLALTLSETLSWAYFKQKLLSCFKTQEMEGGEENNISKPETTKETSGGKGVSKFRRVCVYCGSRTGYKASYSNAALELAKLLVQKQIDLVYGGGSVGLMGLVSTTVFNGGRHVLGVIPAALLPMEVLGETTGEVKIVADMHQRKSEMEKQADAFIALPGGYGTMEELLEIITWSQLGIHTKPVGILNVDGYYDCLLALFDKGVEEGFIDHSARRIFVSANNPAELLQKMEEYAPVYEGVASQETWDNFR